MGGCGGGGGEEGEGGLGEEEGAFAKRVERGEGVDVSGSGSMMHGRQEQGVVCLYRACRFWGRAELTRSPHNSHPESPLSAPETASGQTPRWR